VASRARLALLAACVLVGILSPSARAAVWAPQWLPTTDVSSAGRSSASPSVAVGAGGDGVAVFLASREGVQRVEAAEMRTGGHWREPVDVSPPECSASRADVAMNAGAAAVAVWVCGSGAGSVVEVASKPLRGGWREPVAISGPGAGLGSLDVAVGPGGEAVAAWTRAAGSGESAVELASGAVAGSWSAPVTLGEGGGAQVGVGAAGAAAAIWTSTGGAVEAATRPALGSWGEPAVLAAAGSPDPAPRLGVDEAGRALAVWQRLGVIQASSFAPGGTWGAAEDISRGSEGTAAAPALDVSPDGSAVAAWQLSDPKNGNPLAVQVARARSTGFGGPGGQSFAEPFVRDPAVAIDDLGHTTAVWLRDAGEFARSVRASTTTLGSTVEWRKPLNVSGEANLGPPAVATDGDGNATAVWARRSGGSFKVQSAYYQRTAPPLAQLTATEPPSPANDNSPRILGSVPAGGTVSIYDNSTCSGLPVASGSADQLESTGIQVQVANNTTTQFYATASSGGPSCFGQVSYSERTGTLSMSEALTRLTTLDPLQTPGPLAADWGRVLSYEPGTVSALGWGPVEPYAVKAGGYWKRSAFVDSGTGVAVAARLLASPGTAKFRFFSLLLDLENPVRESEAFVPRGGYELRFVSTGPGFPDAYNVSIRRWPNGSPLVLLNRFSLPLGSYVALVDRGGSLSAWADTGLGFTQLLSVADSAFSEGFAGIEASGDGTRLRRFKAGALPVVMP
jgi:hypothetical protein